MKKESNEIWKCNDCGKEVLVRPDTNYKTWRIKEHCSCGGFWKFKEETKEQSLLEVEKELIQKQWKL